MHRLTRIHQVARYGSIVPYDVAVQLPVMIPNLVDPKAPVYAYRFECACGIAGEWQGSMTAANTSWVDHVNSPEVLEQDAIRDEIARLAERLGARFGVDGVTWIRGLAATPSRGSCPYCGQPDERSAAE